MVIVDNLTAFNVREVYKRGVALSDIAIAPDRPPEALLDTVVLDPVTPADFSLPLSSDIVRVIGLIPESIVTEKVVRKVDVKEGVFADNPHLDLIKIAVFERHNGTRKRSVALVEGFGLQGGALATTISHDSHNIVVIGRKDEEMALAVNRIREIKGGVVFAREGEIVAEIPLPIAGLMSLSSMEEVAAQVEDLKKAVQGSGLAKGIDPILTLAFLSLPVIPALKLTESGLFDGEAFTFCPIEVTG
jgi:adenine deaminase